MEMQWTNGLLTATWSTSMLALCGMGGVLALATVGYLVTIKSTFGHISPEHRGLEPNQVWWVLVPFFGFFWHGIVVVKLCRSLRDAFAAQDLAASDPTFAQHLGLGATVALPIALLLFGWSSLGGWAAMGLWLVLWLLWWLKITRYKREIMA